MKLITPLVAVLTVLVISTSLIPDRRTDDQKIEKSGFELYSVRPDGLCLYVRIQSDGSRKKLKDLSREFTKESLDLLKMRYSN